MSWTLCWRFSALPASFTVPVSYLERMVIIHSEGAIESCEGVLHSHVGRMFSFFFSIFLFLRIYKSMFAKAKRKGFARMFAINLTNMLCTGALQRLVQSCLLYSYTTAICRSVIP